MKTKPDIEKSDRLIKAPHLMITYENYTYLEMLECPLILHGFQQEYHLGSYML